MGSREHEIAQAMSILNQNPEAALTYAKGVLRRSLADAPLEGWLKAPEWDDWDVVTEQAVAQAVHSTKAQMRATRSRNTDPSTIPVLLGVEIKVQLSFQRVRTS